MAYHEAGHAVVARKLGIVVYSINMTPDVDSAARVNLHDVTAISTAEINAAKTNGANTEALTRELHAQLTVVWAGMAAETIAGYQNETGRHIADLNRASDLEGRLAILSSPELVATVSEQAATETFALLEANWPAVVRVARALQEHDYLADDELDRIIAAL